MPMIDVQKNHAVVFALRFGEKQNGRPAKLNGKLRITAANSGVVQAFADVYGGTVQPWEGQFEVYIPRDNLPVMFLPGQAIRQDWELYKGSVCERRCPGAGGIEEKSGKPCLCNPDIDKRIANKAECSPKTELRFVCPEVAVLGTGRLVSHGKIAAETLPQEIQKVQAALNRGYNVPANIQAVQIVGAGKQYVFPRIDLVGTSLNELMSNSSGSFGELSDGRSATVEVPQSLPTASAASGVQERKSLGSALNKATVTVVDDNPSASAGIFANNAQRQNVMRMATKNGVNSEQLETLILEQTNKYLDEADFTVDQINQVLDALNKKVDA